MGEKAEGVNESGWRKQGESAQRKKKKVIEIHSLLINDWLFTSECVFSTSANLFDFSLLFLLFSFPFFPSPTPTVSANVNNNTSIMTKSSVWHQRPKWSIDWAAEWIFKSCSSQGPYFSYFKSHWCAFIYKREVTIIQGKMYNMCQEEADFRAVIEVVMKASTVEG